MKKILLIIITILISNNIIAQINLTDFAKYEMYCSKLRGRLTGDENNRDVYNGFVQVGSEMGTSKKLRK